MTSPQFIEWLDEKMAQFETGKLVPLAEVLADQLTESTRDKLKDRITAEILEAGNINQRIADAMKERVGSLAEAKEHVESVTRTALENDPAQWWTAPVDELAEELAAADG